VAPAIAAAPAPDNSGINARDTQNGPLTPEDQSSRVADLNLTQKVRQAITGDKTLSVNAKNIKIISIGGKVTLRGPVKTPEERDRVASMANQVAGASNVNNQLEVIGTK